MNRAINPLLSNNRMLTPVREECNEQISEQGYSARQYRPAPETKTLRNGTLLTTASLATNERFKQGDEWKDRTEWHSVLFYGKLAEIVRDYVHKGSKLYVEGRIRTDSWEDANQQKRWRTHVVAMEVTLLDSRDGKQPETPAEVLEEDIPF